MRERWRTNAVFVSRYFYFAYWFSRASFFVIDFRFVYPYASAQLILGRTSGNIRNIRFGVFTGGSV